MSKSPKGHFAALVPFFPGLNLVCARKKMAKDFRMKVGLLFSEFTSAQPPGKGLLENERASSSSLSKRNRENMRQRVESNIVGHDKCVEDLVAWLINKGGSNLRVILVVGKHASGKTALVRSVFSKLKIKHHFDCLAWVRVPDLGAESDRIQNLLLDILKQTPLQDQAKDLENKQEEQLLETLHKSLMDHRYLIVVDDLGEASLINKLWVQFVDSMNGSRVIFTIPNAEMQKFAEPWTTYIQLRPHMTKKEGKKLLRVSIAGDDGSKMTILEKKILSKCNRSPPVITLLGGLLSAVEESNWVDLIDRLGEFPNLDDVTRLSFDALTYMMKLRVLYMTLFPKESEVPTRRLFRQWAAEGLLAEAAADGSVQTRLAEDCFRDLESRNLIRVVQWKLDGSARSCRMPAFLHEFFFRKAKELGLLQIQYSSDSVYEKESRGAEQSAQNQQKQGQNTATGHCGYQVRCLQSFASFDTRKLGTQARKPKDLLKSPILGGRLGLLRVLDLEGVYKPELPEKFGNTLSNIRYLGLRWTVLDSIPESVGNLLLLETLDLKHTNITKVTSAIWNAKNLQHLFLSEASFDKFIQCPISSTKLEMLWGLSVETVESRMISVLENLPSLKKLGVTCCPTAVEAVIERVSKMTRLESLRLRSRDLLGQPGNLSLSVTTKSDFHWPTSLSKLYLIGSLTSVPNLSVLPGNLKALTLSMSELNYDPMLSLQCLKDLIVLRLLARSCTGKTLYCGEGSFPKLRALRLWMLGNLQELVVSKGAMPNLEGLDIRQCKELKTVDGLDHINSLKGVSLTRVPEVLDPNRPTGVKVFKVSYGI
ncbi:hypothetical protein BT93_J1851 [Corymbia citriodora subsp. variegata]|nr:hypothetical protein BT93_J1851 [Corymbia citriodora subsp. variegata]